MSVSVSTLPSGRRIFTMARYALCRAADSFVIADGGYDKTVKGIKPGPTLEKLPGFFGRAAQVEGCGRGDMPLIIDGMYSAWWAAQPALDAGLSLGRIEGGYVRQDYM